LSTMPIIEIRDLSHRFSDGRMGLCRINLEIQQGGFILIAGANGSGKTTLLRHLNGLLLPTSGTVTVAGIPVGKDPLKVRQMVGMVFQDADSQIVGETVYEDAAFGPENLKLDPREVRRRTEGALSAVGLTSLSEQHPFLLSAGEKRRLAIAGILSMGPRVIVFDEPLSNLDFPGTRQVLGQMVSLHRSGHTLLVATHDLEPLMAYADRLILMKAGKVERDGHPAALVSDLEAFGVRPPGWIRFAVEGRPCRN